MEMARTFVLGEFFDTDKLLSCVRKLREEGYARLDTYSPFPINGAEEAMGLSRSKVPLFALAAGLSGAVGGFLMQMFFNGFLFPLNVGNRLPYSPIASVPITFECGILACALTIFFGLLAYFFKFPEPYHPVFEVDAFRSATTHAYWVSVELPGIHPEEAKKVQERIAQMGGGNVSVVEDKP